MFQSLLPLLNAGFAGLALLLFLALAAVLSLTVALRAAPRLIPLVSGLSILPPLVVAAISLAPSAHAQNVALCEAVFYNNLVSVQIAIDGGAQVNHACPADAENRSPLHLAARTENAADIIDLLVREGANVNIRDISDHSPLHIAAQIFGDFGDLVDNANALIRNGANIEQKDNWGNTPLHKAARYGNVKVMSALIGAGANVNAINNLGGGETPLQIALDTRRYEAALLLTDMPVSILCLAVQETNSIYLPRVTAEVPVIIERGVNVNGNCGDANDKPLHIAARLGKSGIVDLLLINRAQVNPHNADGKTPFDLAKENGHNEVALKLQQSGARTGEDVVGAANQSELLQLRAELVSLRMEVESLRAEVNAICGATPDCAQAATQRARLAAAENQIGRKTSEVAALFPGGGGGGSGGSGGGGGSGLAIGIGAAALLGIALYAFSPDGDPDAFTLQPSAFYENRNGSETLRYGMRLDYDQDPWRLWWSADDSRFGWGGEWRRDGLRARAAVWETAETLDLNADLGMEWDWRGWAVRPSWRLRAGAGSSGEWSWDSSADLSAEWARAGWTIRPSVRAGDLRRPAEADFHLGLGRAF